MAIKGARKKNGHVTPHLLVRDAAAASRFYTRAFGTTELYRSPLPGGVGHHIQMKLGEGFLLITDESPPDGEEPGHMQVNLGSPQTLCGTSVVLEYYVDDVDAAYQKAVDAGAKATLPLGDTFWGDRYGWVTDPFGHVWALSSVIEELTPEQVQERMAALSGHE